MGITKSYAARAKLLLAVGFFPSVLPGTRGPGHAATASLIPSKPVAPEATQSNDGSTADQPLNSLDVGCLSAWQAVACSQRLDAVSDALLCLVERLVGGRKEPISVWYRLRITGNAERRCNAD